MIIIKKKSGSLWQYYKDEHNPRWKSKKRKRMGKPPDDTNAKFLEIKCLNNLEMPLINC